MNLALILLLAQTCASEISIHPSTQECVVMWEVNYRNAKRSGITLAAHTKKFNAYWRNPNNGRRWVQYLNHEAAEPRYWPKHIKWQHYRANWQRYLLRARKFVNDVNAGRHTALCPAAEDYGGRCDDAGVAACDPLHKTVSCAMLTRCLDNLTLQWYWTLKHCRKNKKRRRNGGKDSS